MDAHKLKEDFHHQTSYLLRTCGATFCEERFLVRLNPAHSFDFPRGRITEFVNMPKERDILKMIYTNFMNSLRRPRVKGNLNGEDKLGNKYFEIPGDRSIGKPKSSRWFEPRVEEDFEQALPSEWEAWLRGRRVQPPTVDEIMRNDAIADLKKKNAAELEQIHHPEAVANPPKKKLQEFPVYDDYEDHKK